MHQRSCRLRHARSVDELPHSRRGDVEVDRRHQRRVRRIVESCLTRGAGRRADRRRRRLRRRLQRRAGTHARICDEIVSLPARPAARSSAHRADGRALVPVIRSILDAGHAAVADPRLSYAGQLRVQGQRSARAVDSASHSAAGAARPRPHVASAVHLRARTAQGRRKAAGRTPLHRGTRDQRNLRR